MARKCRHADFFDGLTRPSMRLLVRVYVFAGAPHGLTVDGLARYWRARSPSWRSAPADDAGGMEATLTRRFLSEGFCGVDGSLRQPLQ